MAEIPKALGKTLGSQLMLGLEKEAESALWGSSPVPAGNPVVMAPGWG